MLAEPDRSTWRPSGSCCGWRWGSRSSPRVDYFYRFFRKADYRAHRARRKSAGRERPRGRRRLSGRRGADRVCWWRAPSASATSAATAAATSAPPTCCARSGRPPALLTLVGDIAKGYLAVWLGGARRRATRRGGAGRGGGGGRQLLVGLPRLPRRQGRGDRARRAARRSCRWRVCAGGAGVGGSRRAFRYVSLGSRPRGLCVPLGARAARLSGGRPCWPPLAVGAIIVVAAPREHRAPASPAPSRGSASALGGVRRQPTARLERPRSPSWARAAGARRWRSISRRRGATVAALGARAPRSCAAIAPAAAEPAGIWRTSTLPAGVEPTDRRRPRRAAAPRSWSVAVPSEFVGRHCSRGSPSRVGAVVVSATKGFDPERHLRMSELIAERFPAAGGRAVRAHVRARGGAGPARPRPWSPRRRGRGRRPACSARWRHARVPALHEPRRHRRRGRRARSRTSSRSPPAWPTASVSARTRGPRSSRAGSRRSRGWRSRLVPRPARWRAWPGSAISCSRATGTLLAQPRARHGAGAGRAAAEARARPRAWSPRACAPSPLGAGAWPRQAGVTLPICAEVAAVLFEGRPPARRAGRAPRAGRDAGGCARSEDPMPELRKDPVVGRWVIISTERARRPSDFMPSRWSARGRPSASSVPATRRRRPPEILAGRAPDRAPEHARLDVPGRAEQVSRPPHRGRAGAVRRGALRPDERRGRPRGRHRDARSRRRRWPRCRSTRWPTCCWAYRERMLDLKKDPRFEYVLVFKNHGEAAGASLEHPHSQLIATPIIPIMVAEELDRLGPATTDQGALRLVRHRAPGAARRGAGSSWRPTASWPWRRSPRAFPSRRGSCPRATARRSRRPRPDELRGLAAVLGEFLRRMDRCSGTRRSTSCCTPRRSATGPARALPLAPGDHPQADAGGRLRVGQRASSSTRCPPRTPPRLCAARCPGRPCVDTMRRRLLQSERSWRGAGIAQW